MALGPRSSKTPLYSLEVTGADGHTVDNALFVVSRGLEETEWWSVYKLGDGNHFFDTYIPLLSFSTTRETMTVRYAGLDVPGDDRLKQPNEVAFLTYAAEDRVIRQASLTCDDPKLATLLRSYADTTRTLSWADGMLKLSFRQNYPSPANVMEVRIPVRKDDLDLAHAQLPPHLRVK